LELDPNSPVTHFYLQSLYEGKGDFPKAVREAHDTALMFGEAPTTVENRTEAPTRALASSGPKGYWQFQLKSLQAAWKKSREIPTILRLSLPILATTTKLLLG